MWEGEGDQKSPKCQYLDTLYVIMLTQYRTYKNANSPQGRKKNLGRE
jgi:hypothetical protein